MQLASDLRALAARPEFEETETASLMTKAAMLLDAQERENAKLREREQRIRELCTTDYESKSVFIARVLAVLNA